MRSRLNSRIHNQIQPSLAGHQPAWLTRKDQNTHRSPNDGYFFALPTTALSLRREPEASASGKDRSILLGFSPGPFLQLQVPVPNQVAESTAKDFCSLG